MVLERVFFSVVVSHSEMKPLPVFDTVRISFQPLKRSDLAYSDCIWLRAVADESITIPV